MSSKDTSSPEHLFSSDRPITRLDEDKLDRRSFAEQLARAVRGWKGNDSLVIALYGPWGTGKSSIKNMVIDALRAAPERVSVVDFNPWQVANRASLTEAFFDEIGIALRKGPIASKKAQRRTVSKWKRYAARLKSSKQLLDLFINPLRAILILSAVLIFGATLPDLRSAAFIVGAVYLLVAALLTWLFKVAEQIAAFKEPGTEKETLEEVKSAVRKELAELSAPILVLVDDLDRLTPTELLEIFQLVKANGDFPNLVYVLLCDRPTVEKHIQEVMKGAEGRDYLEKIVQIPFDVPLLDRQRVREILFKGLDTLLADAAVSKNFDQTRWGNIFFGGLQQYFDTLRQVNRYLSSLSFHVSMFKTDGDFEVNVVDLIALEALRVYEPEVYQALSENKRLLTSLSDLDRGQNSEPRRKLNAILEGIPAERVNGVRDMIKRLFPPAEWAFGGSHYGADWSEAWYRELRVCAEDVFDRYFHFVLPKGELSQATISRLLAATNDRAALRAELNQLAAAGQLEVAMDRLEAYKQQIPIAHAVPFLTALFDVGDQVSDQERGMFELSPAMHARRIVYWYLKQEENLPRRGELVRTAMEQTDGLLLPIGFTSLIDPDPDRRERAEEFVPADILRDLKGICIEKINASAAAGRLPNQIAEILYRWREWAGPEEPTAFCTRLVETTDGLLRLLKAFLVCGRSHGMSDHVAKLRWFIRRRDIEAFLSFDLVEAKVNALPTDLELSTDDKRAVDAFKKAAERRRAGRADDDPFARD